MQEQITDEVLLNALRKRLLEELGREQQSQNSIYNIIGGGGAGGRGIEEAMSGSPGAPTPQGGGGEIDPGLFDYFVDINKSNVYPDEMMEGGIPREDAKPTGWSKQVHRYRKKKDRGSP